MFYSVVGLARCVSGIWTFHKYDMKLHRVCFFLDEQSVIQHKHEWRILTEDIALFCTPFPILGNPIMYFTAIKYRQKIPYMNPNTVPAGLRES